MWYSPFRPAGHKDSRNCDRLRHSVWLRIWCLWVHIKAKCTLHEPLTDIPLDVSVMNPMLALLCDHPQELGSVYSIFTARPNLTWKCSARMGFAFLFTGFAGLIGPPINGALLTSKYTWWRPIVFSGVRQTLWHWSSLAMLICIINQVIAFVGVAAFLILRILLWRRRGDSAKWIIWNSWKITTLSLSFTVTHLRYLAQ